MTARTFRIGLAGSEVAYPVTVGDNLLRAGLRAGIGLPYECNAGGCGSCKFELVSGEVEELWPDAPGLSAKDRTRGRRLACQCRPLSDCEIKMRPDASFAPLVPPVRFEASFTGSRQITRDIREFQFRGPQPASFLPGQYALVDLPGAGQPRAYSMSNLPNAEGDWHFMVRQVPQGLVSALLFEKLEPGATVSFDGPLGLAHLRTDSERDIVCVAGGSGLAPIHSILNAAVRRDVLAPRELWLFYGGRATLDIPAFDSLLDAPERIKIHASISAADALDDAAWGGSRGHVHELVAQKLGGDFSALDYYLAGPPPMIESVVKMLMLDHAVPAQQIHYDRFF